MNSKKENLIVNPYEVLRNISKSPFLDIRSIAKSCNLKLISNPEELLKLSKGLNEDLMCKLANELAKLHYYVYIAAKCSSDNKKD